MFAIKTINLNREEREQEHVWHVQDKTPTLSKLERVTWFQADGDELEQVIKRFPNLPYCFRICQWRGELAQFIFDNL